MNTMNHAYICDALRTPIGRYGGALASIRPDDLAAMPIKALMAKNPQIDWQAVDEVIFGCANQAGEDNRNVARMASLLAGMPVSVPATTINRLCGSGMDAVGNAARAIKSGEAELIIAGGVESMSRAPFVMAKAESAYSRQAQIFDTTIGWRFINPLLQAQYGSDSMAQTADYVAQEFNISRADQDAFALRSQQRWKSAHAAHRFDDEIIPVAVTQKNKPALIIDCDEQPRPDTTLEQLTSLKTINGRGAEFTVTAGNASGVNDGACALILASESALKKYQLTPLARVVGMATAGVPPRIMGIGPAPAVQKLLTQTQMSLSQMAVIELNEAFSAQALAVLRQLGLPDDGEHINPNGGAIAIGHPLGMSGARLITTASYELCRRREQFAICAMCIGVGQGIALMIERV